LESVDAQAFTATGSRPSIPSRKWRAAVLCLVGFGFCAAAFWPGFMSADSVDQFAQATNGAYQDWHPPLMAFVWSRVLFLSRGPAPMLLMHLAFIWLGLWLLAAHLSSSRYAWWALPMVGILPWIVNFEGVIWKDTGLAASWLLAIALMTLRPRRRVVQVGIALLMFYGIGVRHNAIFGAPPMVFLFLRYALGWHRSNSRTAVYALAGCVGFLLVGAAVKSAIGPRRTYPASALMIDDLHNISIRTGQNLLPARLQVTSELIDKCMSERAAVVFCYQRFGWVRGDTTTRPGEFHGFLANDAEYKEVRARWINVLEDHRADYFATRLASFAWFMRIHGEPFFYWQQGTAPNPYGITQNSNLLTRVIARAVQITATRAGFLMKPYFWTVVSLLLGVFVFVRKDLSERPVVLALLSSASLYSLAYLPLTASADFRYVYWSLVATTVAVAMLLTGLDQRTGLRQGAGDSGSRV
jgi:hypothetical protein